MWPPCGWMTSATQGPGKTQPDADERRPGPAPAGRLARHGPVIALVCELIVATVFFVRQAPRLWFFADDWEFLLNRRLSSDTLDTLFRPHNEHWSTVPILVFRTLFTSFGVRHYLPFGHRRSCRGAGPVRPHRADAGAFRRGPGKRVALGVRGRRPAATGARVGGAAGVPTGPAATDAGRLRIRIR